METGKIISGDGNHDEALRRILTEGKTVAVLGLSPKPERDSHMVAKYLKEHGYRIIPVRPAQKEILGEAVHPSLDAIAEAGVQVDIVDVFRNSADVSKHVDEAIRLRPKVFWMQLDVENEKAARRLSAAGIDVVMNRCIKIEYERVIKRTRIV